MGDGASCACVAMVGTEWFEGRHTGENILKKLQSIRMLYGLLPTLPPEHPLTENEIRANPARAFDLEDPCDRMSITTDRGTDMIKAANSGTFDWTPCICHALNTAVEHGLKESGIMTLLTPLRSLAKQLRQSPLLWNKFCDIQREFLSEGKEPGSDGDDSDEDYSRCDSSDESVGCLSDDDARVGVSDDDSEVEVEEPTRVLRLGSWCETRWNSTFYLIKRAVLLEKSIRNLMVQAEKDVTTPIPANAWACYRSLLPVMESIKELSVRCEGETYVTISDVLYNVLKLLYDRMPAGDERWSGQPYVAEFVVHFRRKLVEIIDEEDILYMWSLAAIVDGRRSSLHFLRRMWDCEGEFPKLRAAYKTLSSWKGMMRDHLTNLVSSHLNISIANNVMYISSCACYFHEYQPA